MTGNHRTAPEGSERLPHISPLPTRHGFNRRRFLVAAGTLASLGAAVPAAVSLRGRGLLSVVRRPRFDHEAPTGRLSDREMAGMLALLEILVPVTLWPSREAMVAMVHRATEQQQGALKEYQAGLALLERTAQAHGVKTSFAEASTEERQRILETLMWKYDGGTSGDLAAYTAKAHRGLEWLLQSDSERRFRELVARDLLRRFYAERVTWAMVGYSRSPGLPGDPREYVRPAPVRAAPSEASEQ